MSGIKSVYFLAKLGIISLLVERYKQVSTLDSKKHRVKRPQVTRLISFTHIRDGNSI